MKTCKQCGRSLPLESFRRYAPRGRGIYKTTQGYNTICKDCESMSAKAAKALRDNDAAKMEKFKWYYKTLQDLGFEPVTAPAKKLLGVVDTKPQKESLDEQMHRMLGDADIQLHCQMVKERSYTSFEEADEMHKKLASRLKAAGLYEEVNDLMDDWYLEA